jgi:hypothetical protein
MQSLGKSTNPGPQGSGGGICSDLLVPWSPASGADLKYQLSDPCVRKCSPTIGVPSLQEHCFVLISGR